MQPAQEQIVSFFNCFGRETTPLRWDRVAGLQLLLAAFIDVVGYDDVHTRSQTEFNAIGDGLVSAVIRRNLELWFPELKLLDESGAAKISRALNPALRLPPKVPSVMGPQSST